MTDRRRRLEEEIEVKIARTMLGVSGVLALAAGLAACSEEGPSEAGDGDAQGGNVESVGLMLQDISNPFFASMQNTMEELAEQEGFSLNVQDGRQDLAEQNSQIDAFIQQDVDLIIINAVDSDGIGSAIERAKEAGIPVVAVDVDAEGADAAVTTDNVEAGRMACTALAERIGGSGEILILEGTPTTAPRERVEGCEEVLGNDFPEIEVVGKQATTNDRATGLEVATDLLTANPDVDGIFALNDPVALGADLALQQANIDGVVIVGVDGSPEAVEAMNSGNTALWATPAQDPGGMVEQAYYVGVGLAQGEAPDSRLTLLDPSLVTLDDVSEYGGW